jgi:hypothetical protein
MGPPPFQGWSSSNRIDSKKSDPWLSRKMNVIHYLNVSKMRGGAVVDATDVMKKKTGYNMLIKQ